MQKNVGASDRIIRLLIAALLIGLYASGFAEGALGIILLVFAAVMIATSIIRFCPIYLPFNLNTIQKRMTL